MFTFWFLWLDFWRLLWT